MTFTLFGSLVHLLVANTVTSNVETRSATVGETVRLKCPEISSQLNSLSWFGPPNMTQYSDGLGINPDIRKAESVIVNLERGEFFLEIRNVSHSDSGLYRCRILNDLPKDYDFNLLIRYAPGINVQLDLTRTNAEQLVIKCKPNGQEALYSFLWEHLSIFGEHIRYLSAQSNGDAVVPVEQPHFHSSGIYRCLATYGPLGHTNKTLIVQEMTVLVKGKPFVIAVNLTHDCQKAKITAFVYSYPKYTNISVFYNGVLKHIYSNTDRWGREYRKENSTEIADGRRDREYPKEKSTEIADGRRDREYPKEKSTEIADGRRDREYPKEKSTEITEPIHGVYVRLHGYKVTFLDFIVADNGSKNYTVFVENEYGYDQHTVRAFSEGCLFQTGHSIRWITGIVLSTLLSGFIVVVATVYCRKNNPETVNSQSSENSGMHHEYDEIENVPEETFSGVSTALAGHSSVEEELQSDKEDDYIVPMPRATNKYTKTLQAVPKDSENQKNETESENNFDTGFEAYLKNANNTSSEDDSLNCEDADGYQQIILRQNHDYLKIY